jgi:formate dehydrogenase subunit beta
MMAVHGIIEVKEGKINEAVNSFLQGLLDRKIVELILAPKETPVRKSVVQSLIADSEDVSRINTLAPVMPVNSARIVSAMTKVTPVEKNTAVLLRPCEARALVELVKLKQASLENIMVISMDCLGTYSMEDYEGTHDELTFEHDLTLFRGGKEDPRLRTACRMCEYPTPLFADLQIGFIGMPEDEILIKSLSQTGDEVMKHLGLKDAGDLTQREKAVSEFLSRRVKARDEFFAQTSEETSGVDKFMAVFETCINCHNCKTACPVCYCKECFFDSPTFEFESARFISWAEAKGSVRMPTDTLLFHLTRMNHMGCSCVACGHCEEACPNGIPLLKIFKLGGFNIQKIFDYVPGRSLADELPLSIFREDELHEVGEK